jgi:cytochrome oxidase Cu insertion factor (SCO1/SenC/PrrC family)
MDHSTITYLMDKQGKFLKHFSYSTDAAAMAKDLAAAVTP